MLQFVMRIRWASTSPRDVVGPDQLASTRQRDA